MNLPEIIQIAGGMGAGLGIINLLWTWHNQAQAPTAMALKDLECDVENLAPRVQALELEIKHLPTKDEIMQLNLQLTRMTGKLDVVEAELNSTGRILRRMEDHMRSERA